MTNVLAIRPEPYECDFGLVYDLNALSHNAKVVRSITNACQFRPRVVLKGGYANPNIVRRLGSIERFPLAIGNSVGESASDCGVRDVATLYPGQAVSSQAWRSVGRVTEVNLAGIAEALRFFDRPDLMIAVQTSEDREGLRPQEIPQFIDEVASRFGGRVCVAGFQLNYGCVVEAPPPIRELDSLMESLCHDSILGRLSAQPFMSFGGSVLLPVLHQVHVPGAYVAELRIGEAVIAGTIPGQPSSPLGLEPTAWMNVPVTQTRHNQIDQHKRLVVNVGTQILCESRVRNGRDGLFVESMGSEVSVIRQTSDHRDDTPDFVSFRLRYSEIERALHRLSANSKPPMIHWPGC